MKENKQVIVIGGGAAGYFCAINTKNSANVIILEKTNNVLGKVKISGGGRCNITNMISAPGELVKFYPRGEKELFGPFKNFNTTDTVKWFEEKGIKLKAEVDGRIFPITNNSQTIIDLFLREADKNKIKLLTKINISDIRKEDESWAVMSDGQKFMADYLVIASGSNFNIWNILKKLGHNIIQPVPSLFTFNMKDKRLSGLAGVSANVTCHIEGFNKKAEGPLLVTHWGVSGPAILKLSSFAARFLYEKNYHFTLSVNWAPGLELKELKNRIEEKRDKHDRKFIHSNNLFGIPVRLWEKLIEHTGINKDKRWAELSNKQIDLIIMELHKSVFNITGKSTFKEEFVTAGGVELKEVNFKTMESKLHKNLFFAGEVLDIDALTGGFNFQSAWTTAWLAAKELSGRI